MLRPALSALALAALLAPSAHAAPDCPGGPAEARTLASNQGTLESVIAHPNGNLYYSTDGGLMILDAPGGAPQLFAQVEEPGGLAIEPDGTIVVGTGNSIPNGSVGDQTGPAGLLRVDPVTGVTEPYADGLSMANGVDRAPNGVIYASNDIGMNIDRIIDGETERGWTKVDSGNGLQVDTTGRWLYVAQTFRPAAIQRVDLRTGDVEPFAVAPPEDIAAGFDGMDRDAADNLFVTANGAGSVWKVTPAADMCVVLGGLAPFPDGPSAVAVGAHGTDFPPENIYVVAFNGDLIEIAGVAEADPPPALELTVRPRRTRAGRRTEFHATVTSNAGAPMTAALVRLAGRRVRTDERGEAVLSRRFQRRGKRRAAASSAGFSKARLKIRVRRR
ncbi:MAG TPA: hypothetical protein VD790_06095 [Thermoleophilaceae bacterium]|nr:hypothetical protein [Thermoleophilaceae bacterium]